MSVEVCVTIGTFIVLETDLLITLDTSNGTAIGMLKHVQPFTVTVYRPNVLNCSEYHTHQISTVIPCLSYYPCTHAQQGIVIALSGS